MKITEGRDFKAERIAKTNERRARADGWKYRSITKNDAAKMGAQMATWFLDNPDADNLWDYLLNREPYSPSQIYEMRKQCEELDKALDFIYGLIAARAQKGWKEINAAKYYEKMFQTFSPELKELMREQAQLAAKTGQPIQTIHITSDSMGMLAKREEE